MYLYSPVTIYGFSNSLFFDTSLLATGCFINIQLFYSRSTSFSSFIPLDPFKSIVAPVNR